MATAGALVPPCPHPGSLSRRSPSISHLLRLFTGFGAAPGPGPRLPAVFFLAASYLPSAPRSSCSRVPAAFLRRASSLALRFFEKGKQCFMISWSPASSSKAVPSLPSQWGAFPPSALVLSCGTDEASCIRFPVCGLRPLSMVRSRVVQLGLPLFSSYHRTSCRPAVSLMESEPAGGWVLPWTCLFFKKWVVFPAFSLFFCTWQKKVQCEAGALI